jgi:sporulation protein YqfC
LHRTRNSAIYSIIVPELFGEVWMSLRIKSNHKNFKQKSNKELYNLINRAKKQEKAERESYLEILSSQLRIPSDVIAGAPIITAIGRNELCIESYKGILEYNNCCIKIMTGIGKVVISGKNLNISYFTNDEMKITGLVHSIEFN